jgi:hypothetical protein
VVDKNKMDKEDKPTFQGWLVRVDAELLSSTDMVHNDFPPHDLKKWFDERMTPAQAALKIIDGTAK